MAMQLYTGLEHHTIIWVSGPKTNHGVKKQLQIPWNLGMRGPCVFLSGNLWEVPERF